MSECNNQFSVRERERERVVAVCLSEVENILVCLLAHAGACYLISSYRELLVSDSMQPLLRLVELHLPLQEVRQK